MRLFSLEGKVAVALGVFALGAGALRAVAVRVARKRLRRRYGADRRARGVRADRRAHVDAHACQPVPRARRQRRQFQGRRFPAFRSPPTVATSSATSHARTTSSGRVLREERQGLFQRELLLDTVVQNTPTALVLTDPTRPSSSMRTSPLASCSTAAGALQGLDVRRPWWPSAPPAFALAVADGGDTLFHGRRSTGKTKPSASRSAA